MLCGRPPGQKIRVKNFVSARSMDMEKRHLREAGIIVIGDEILFGRRKDKHLRHVTGFLGGKGIDLKWAYYLGDDRSMLADHFKRIAISRDVCFSFGGIGATPDDRTRQAVADAHDVTLVRHPEAVRLLELKFGTEAYPNRIKMAELPEGATLIPNDYNTIPGFSVGDIHCLPGFPEMAWQMMDWVLQSLYELPECIATVSRSVVVEGAHESVLVPVLEKSQKLHPELKISSLPRFPAGGRRLIELGVRGDRSVVDITLDQLEEEIGKMGYQCTRGTIGSNGAVNSD